MNGVQFVLRGRSNEGDPQIPLLVVQEGIAKGNPFERVPL